MSFQIGEQVYISRLARYGTVTKVLGKEKLELSVANMKLVVSTSEVRLSENTARKSSKKASSNKQPKRSIYKKVKSLTIDVHGKTVAETLELLSTKLNEAITGHYSSLIVIHGKGSGALKTAVHSYLSSSDLAIRYELRKSNEGETVIFLES